MAVFLRITSIKISVTNKNTDILIPYDEVDERVFFIDVYKWGRWLIYLLKGQHIPRTSSKMMT